MKERVKIQPVAQPIRFTPANFGLAGHPCKSMSRKSTKSHAAKSTVSHLMGSDLCNTERSLSADISINIGSFVCDSLLDAREASAKSQLGASFR